MILGIGFDLCSVSRMERGMERFGERFLEKILTDAEIAALPSAGRGPRAAGRFAVKEAVVKALGTGFAEGITMHNVEVINLESGAPEVILTGAALERSRAAGVAKIWVSLSHEQDVAGATVILEG